MKTAILTAGIPAKNMILYHSIRFLAGDPAALIILPSNTSSTIDGVSNKRQLIIRDIEMERARAHARADAVSCPADHAPKGGLSGDRETATAQATAQLLLENDISRVIVDRSLPYSFANELLKADIAIQYDPDKGVVNRRSKDQQEIECLRQAQHDTETVMARALSLIANASANAQGILQHEGEPLTADRVRTLLDIWLLELGYANPPSIVACGTEGGDCHNLGTGLLKTGQPIIIDIFPQNKRTLYNGDCTRCVVHGDIPDTIAQMHRAIVEAKAAAINACQAGATGEQVHNATTQVIEANGYSMGLPTPDAPDTHIAMTHGTGHGVGLEVHEPPLLDKGGPELINGDALTIEPGLYSKALGGLRIEDMVIVTPDGCINLNTLPEHLTWKS